MQSSTLFVERHRKDYAVAERPVLQLSKLRSELAWSRKLKKSNLLLQGKLSPCSEVAAREEEGGEIKENRIRCSSSVTKVLPQSRT